MKLLLVADAFYPMRSSAAILINDLARELYLQGHQVVILVPTAEINGQWQINSFDEFRLVLIKTPKTKDMGYLRRVIAEALSPFFIFPRFKLTPIIDEVFDGIIWYSPTIFLGPLVGMLKQKFKCPAYLILRDIFPDWALDLGLIKKGMPYFFLKYVEGYQYKIANYIGIQAPGNFKYFDKKQYKQLRSKVQLLWNWTSGPNSTETCPVNLSKTNLAGKKILIYAGNMGIAQDLVFIINLVELYKNYDKIGFYLLAEVAKQPI